MPLTEALQAALAAVRSAMDAEHTAWRHHITAPTPDSEAAWTLARQVTDAAWATVWAVKRDREAGIIASLPAIHTAPPLPQRAADHNGAFARPA